jgi:hypothetical protein
MAQGKDYGIRGGAAGRERLRILSRVMQASTTSLFDRAGTSPRSSQKLVSEHWKTAPGLLARGLVLNHIRMLREATCLSAAAPSSSSQHDKRMPACHFSP